MWVGRIIISYSPLSFHNAALSDFKVCGFCVLRLWAWMTVRRICYWISSEISVFLHSGKYCLLPFGATFTFTYKPLTIKSFPSLMNAWRNNFWCTPDTVHSRCSSIYRAFYTSAGFSKILMSGIKLSVTALSCAFFSSFAADGQFSLFCLITSAYLCNCFCISEASTGTLDPPDFLMFIQAL